MEIRDFSIHQQRAGFADAQMRNVGAHRHPHMSFEEAVKTAEAHVGTRRQVGRHESLPGSGVQVAEDSVDGGAVLRKMRSAFAAASEVAVAQRRRGRVTRVAVAEPHFAKDSATIDRVLSHLDAHYREEISVTDLVACPRELSSFHRLFKRHMRMPVSAYVAHCASAKPARC